MIGDVMAKVSLDGEIKSKAVIVGDISSNCIIGDVEIGKVVIEQYGVDEYEGEYSVTPSGEIQILETSNKRMANDVEVKAIPYYDVSNEYGRTIYIGGEI